MINERAFESNTNSTNPRGSKIEFYTTPQYSEREQYEKDLKAFTLEAMQSILTVPDFGTLGHVAESALNMAIVQMTAIKQHLTEKYDYTKY